MFLGQILKKEHPTLQQYPKRVLAGTLQLSSAFLKKGITVAILSCALHCTEPRKNKGRKTRRAVPARNHASAVHTPQGVGRFQCVRKHTNDSDTMEVQCSLCCTMMKRLSNSPLL